MVEAYKTRVPQARDQRAAEPRESAREKLDALVKETASKLTPDKAPKTKTKSRKGPELPKRIQDVIRNPYPTRIKDRLTYNGSPITWACAKKMKEALRMLIPAISA